MAQRSTNTLSELIQRMLSDIAQAKTVLPDSDLPFLYELEAILVGKTREPVQQMQDQGQLPNQGQMPPSGFGPNGGGMMPGGVAPMAAAPPVDELRRLLATG